MRPGSTGGENRGGKRLTFIKERSPTSRSSQKPTGPEGGKGKKALALFGKIGWNVPGSQFPRSLPGKRLFPRSMPSKRRTFGKKSSDHTSYGERMKEGGGGWNPHGSKKKKVIPKKIWKTCAEGRGDIGSVEVMRSSQTCQGKEKESHQEKKDVTRIPKSLRPTNKEDEKKVCSHKSSVLRRGGIGDDPGEPLQKEEKNLFRLKRPRKEPKAAESDGAPAKKEKRKRGKEAFRLLMRRKKEQNEASRRKSAVPKGMKDHCCLQNLGRSGTAFRSGRKSVFVGLGDGKGNSPV